MTRDAFNHALLDAPIVSSDEEGDIEMLTPEQRVHVLEKKLKDLPCIYSALTPQPGTPAHAKIAALVCAKALAIYRHRRQLVKQVRRDKKTKGEPYPKPCTTKSFKEELQSFDSKQNQDYNALLVYYHISPDIKLFANWISDTDIEGYIEELEDCLDKSSWLLSMSYIYHTSNPFLKHVFAL